MDTKKNAAASDRQLIESLGGAAKVAKLLGYESRGSVQRVHNWKERGIPPAVKLTRPEIFLIGMSSPPRKKKARPVRQPTTEQSA